MDAGFANTVTIKLLCQFIFFQQYYTTNNTNEIQT